MSIAARGMLEELKGLPSTDKLEIIGEIWKSIPHEDIPVPDSVLDEMDRRFADYLRQPDRAASWSELEHRIREKIHS